MVVARERVQFLMGFALAFAASVANAAEGRQPTNDSAAPAVNAATTAAVPSEPPPQPAPPVAASEPQPPLQPQPQSVTASEPPPQAQSSADARRSQRLEATLRTLAQEGHVSRGSSAIYLVNAAIFLPLGSAIAFASEDGESEGSRGARVVAMSLSLIGGTAYLAVGIRRLAGVTTTDEERFVRFTAQKRAGTLDVFALSSYEGELRAEAAISKASRRAGGVSAIASASAGATVVAFTAASDLRRHNDSQVLGYVIGGTLIATGLWDAIASFTSESPNERAWREYQAAQAKNQLATRRATAPLTDVAITPSLGGSVGLGLQGRF